MRRLTACLVITFLFGCSDATDNEVPPPGSGAGGAGTTNTTTSTGTGGPGSDPLDFPSDDDFDEDATPDDALDPTIAAPTQLTGDDGALVNITSDDRVVYTTADGVWSIKVAAGAPPRKAASTAGTIVVKGRTIFNFADVDYDTGTGYLTYWTPPIGRRTVGEALIGEDMVAARHDDAFVMFVRNIQPDTIDIVIASADKENAAVLVEGAARGGEDTCAPSFGFAGDAAVVSWCELGEMDATLARFVPGLEGDWQKEIISEEAQGIWSSDTLGQTFFYITTASEGRITDMTTEQTVGDGVGWGMLVPDGNTVFFAVGDQLRRRDAGDSVIPIVVDGYADSVAWSPGYSKVLYSSEVIYDDGNKQDLRATSTDWFNPSPAVLVAEPKAVLGRSTLTAAGNHALYFTDVTEQGGTLHVRPLSGAPGATLLKVDTVLAAHDGVILFTDNRTPPNTYPVLVDMKVYDAATGAPPHMLEAGIVEGRNIQVRSDRHTVIYRREGDPDVGGIWARPIL